MWTASRKVEDQADIDIRGPDLVMVPFHPGLASAIAGMETWKGVVLERGPKVERSGSVSGIGR